MPMAAIELTDEERAVVRKWLESAQRELYHEIHKTEFDRGFREELKKERDLVEAVLKKLG